MLQSKECIGRPRKTASSVHCKTSKNRPSECKYNKFIMMVFRQKHQHECIQTELCENERLVADSNQAPFLTPISNLQHALNILAQLNGPYMRSYFRNQSIFGQKTIQEVLLKLPAKRTLGSQRNNLQTFRVGILLAAKNMSNPIPRPIPTIGPS